LTTAFIAIAVILAAVVAIHAYAQWTIRNIDQQTALGERVPSVANDRVACDSATK
jgi:hypothetical protein